MNLRLTGTLAAFGPQSSAAVTVGGDLGGTTFTGGAQSTGFAPTTSGFLVGQSGPEITTPTATLPVNMPFRLSLSLGTSASIVPPPGMPSNLFASSDYSNTFAFSTQRPVFNLPAGYTANSVQAGVINNTYVIPEPVSFGLMCPSALFLLSRRRGRSDRMTRAGHGPRMPRRKD